MGWLIVEILVLLLICFHAIRSWHKADKLMDQSADPDFDTLTKINFKLKAIYHLLTAILFAILIK